jgi:hypothetical protein
MVALEVELRRVNIATQLTDRIKLDKLIREALRGAYRNDSQRRESYEERARDDEEQFHGEAYAVPFRG